MITSANGCRMAKWIYTKLTDEKTTLYNSFCYADATYISVYGIDVQQRRRD